MQTVTTTGRRTFPAAAFTIWNSLCSDDIFSSSCLQTHFCHHLKISLFQRFLLLLAPHFIFYFDYLFCHKNQLFNYSHTCLYTPDKNLNMTCGKPVLSLQIWIKASFSNRMSHLVLSRTMDRGGLLQRESSMGNVHRRRQRKAEHENGEITARILSSRKVANDQRAYNLLTRSFDFLSHESLAFSKLTQRQKPMLSFR